MKIKKGTLCFVKHSRSGNWYGVAYEDFDTEDEWYSLILDEEAGRSGLNTEWEKGEKMPCRKSLCKIEIINEDNNLVSPTRAKGEISR